MSPSSSSPAVDTSTNNSPTPAAEAANNNNNNNNNPLLREDPLLSPLEQEVLDEYAKLLGNMNELSSTLADLSTQPAAEMLDSLRLLERKTATVCTLLKASVYSIVLQQQIYSGEGGGGGGGGGGTGEGEREG